MIAPPLRALRNPLFGTPTLQRALAGEAATDLVLVTRRRLLGMIALLLGLVLLSLAATFLAWQGVAGVIAPQPVALLVNAGFASGVVGFSLVVLAALRPQWSPWLAPPVALFVGLFMAGLSLRAELRFPGIALQSLALTLCAAAAIWLAHATGLIKVTDRFRLVAFAATSAIGLVYLASLLLWLFFDLRLPLLHDDGIGAILWRGFIVVVAAMTLAIDYERIERSLGTRLPLHGCWYLALGVTVTLVWLYISILRLLMRLRR